MEDSFIRRPWNPNPNPNPNPFRRADRFPEERPKRLPSKRKVFSIPIHFVDLVAESKRKASAAVKIQKVFRGSLERKKLKILMKFEKEVDEIQMTIERDEDFIRREEKERIRIHEMLMGVLFRLDSVRGVRDYRKKVIRRVVSLQEALDLISSVRSEPMEDQASIVEELMEEEEEEEDWSIVIKALETKESGAKGPMMPENVEPERSEGMMGRIVEDNKRLNELVSVLAKRVEHLEKTVETMERRRKKKKMETNIGLVYENSTMGGQ